MKTKYRLTKYKHTTALLSDRMIESVHACCDQHKQTVRNYVLDLARFWSKKKRKLKAAPDEELYQLSLHMTKEEIDEIKQYANEAGKNVSQFLRDVEYTEGERYEAYLKKQSKR